ncbi:MAG: hypothetical protein JW709_07485 [Sedimentisphaerales bacterium]|nr:hypothetical protein [Sedimentisphaerales bacterium]
MQVVIIIFVIIFIVVGIIVSSIAARKRREELGLLAQRLGLVFTPGHDADMDNRYPFLGKLKQGSNRYAFNILSGIYNGHEVMVFDYHYETHSTDSKGRRQTHHHNFSFFILNLPISCPELLISREGLFSKIAQAFGYDDIDFESHEFSRRFCVRSRDKKFAYDVCHARMMEYLLANPDLSIEIEQNVLTLYFSGSLKVPEIEMNLNRLLEIRSLLPAYLFGKEA